MRTYLGQHKCCACDKLVRVYDWLPNAIYCAKHRDLEDGRNEIETDARAWADELDAMRRERDEARAEVERLRAMLPPTAHTGVRNGPGEGSWSVFAEKVVAERDEARAEVKRLRELLDGYSTGEG